MLCSRPSSQIGVRPWEKSRLCASIPLSRKWRVTLSINHFTKCPEVDGWKMLFQSSVIIRLPPAQPWKMLSGLLLHSCCFLSQTMNVCLFYNTLNILHCLWAHKTFWTIRLCALMLVTESLCHLAFASTRDPVIITILFASNLTVEFLFIRQCIIEEVLQLLPYSPIG